MPQVIDEYQFEGLAIILDRIRQVGEGALFTVNDLNQTLTYLRTQATYFYDPSKVLMKCLDEIPDISIKHSFIEANYNDFFSRATTVLSAEQCEFLRAVSLEQEEAYEEAIELLVRILDNGYIHFSIYQLLSKIYFQLEKIIQSEKYAILAVLANPKHESNFINYGNLLINLEQEALAERCFEQALKLNPTNSIAAFHVGLFRRKHALDAIRKFEEENKSKMKMDSIAKIKVINQAYKKNWLLSTTMREGVQNILNQFELDTISIFGAGNCNNYNINKLSSQYREVHLIDVDRSALNYTRTNQKVENKKNIHYYFGIDLTSIINDMLLWHIEFPSPDEIRKEINKMIEKDFELKSKTKVTLSDCLIQSVIGIFEEKITSGNRLFKELCEAFILKHVDQLLKNTEPGGYVILVNEMMNSNNNEVLRLGVDSLGEVIPENLERFRRELMYFTNPYDLRDLIKNNSKLYARISSLEISDPWVWHFPGINYLVSAVVIQKR